MTSCSTRILLVAGCCVLSAAAFAAETKPAAIPGKPLLGKQLLPGGPAAKSARLQKLQSLVDTEGWMKDPFRHLGNDMEDVVSDFGDRETANPADVTQPQIVSRLDVLIKLLEKQCKGGGGAGGRPLADSVRAGGPGGQGDLRAPKQSQRKWAELTAKDRERILQAQTAGFPSGYEEILSEYYRRLSAEEAVRAVAPAATPKAADKNK